MNKVTSTNVVAGYVSVIDTERLTKRELTAEQHTLRDAVLFVGEAGFIICNNECIHALPKEDGKWRMPVWSQRTDEDGRVFMGVYPCAELSGELDELLAYAQGGVPDWPTWVHYWGVKDRIEYNWKLLARSLQEVGCEYALPQWGRYAYPGRSVDVYQKPYTQEDFEARGTLVGAVPERNSETVNRWVYEWWQVNIEGEVVERLVRAERA